MARWPPDRDLGARGSPGRGLEDVGRGRVPACWWALGSRLRLSMARRNASPCVGGRSTQPGPFWSSGGGTLLSGGRGESDANTPTAIASFAPPKDGSSTSRPRVDGRVRRAALGNHPRPNHPTGGKPPGPAARMPCSGRTGIPRGPRLVPTNVSCRIRAAARKSMFKKRGPPYIARSGEYPRIGTKGRCRGRGRKRRYERTSKGIG